MKRILTLSILFGLGAAQAPIKAESHFVKWAQNNISPETKEAISFFSQNIKSEAIKRKEDFSKNIGDICRTVQKGYQNVAEPAQRVGGVAWEGIKALGLDIKDAGTAAFNIVKPVVNNPAVNFLIGLAATSAATIVVKDMQASANAQLKNNLVRLQGFLYHVRYLHDLSPNNIQYIKEFYARNLSVNLYQALRNVSLLADTPGHNYPAEERALLRLKVVVDHEIRALDNSWLPALTYAGGCVASTLWALHKVNVLSKLDR